MKRYNDCMEVREDFSAYLDGEMSAEEREPLEAHLAGCAECLREMDLLKRVDDSFRALAPLGAPANFEESVREAVRTGRIPSAGGRRPVPRWMGPLVAMASAAAVLIAGVLVLESRQSDRSAMQMASAPAETESKEARVAREKIVLAEPGAIEADSTSAAGAEKAWDQFARAPARGDKAWEEFVQTAPSAAAPMVGGREDNVESLAESLVARDASEQRAVPDASSAVSADSVDAVTRARAELIGTPPPTEETGAVSQKLFDLLKDEKADAPQAPAAPAGAQSQAGTVMSRQTLRTFHVIAGGVWVEEGYDHGPTTPLKRGSRELRELMKKYPEAEWSKLLERTARQVFQMGESWYDLEAAVDEEP